MPDSLVIEFQNQTASSTVFAYITGNAISNNSLVLLQSDGQTPYFPTQPSANLQPLTADCGIPLGPPGSSRRVTIPQIAGGRIWFSIEKPLVFLLNAGGDGHPALVTPSVSNPGDLNYHTDWSFCEFTLNKDQLYANISYVDFVGPPIALKLTSKNPNTPTQYVTGMRPDGRDTVAQGLRDQNARDQIGWDQLIVTRPDGSPLRILSPNNGHVMNPTLFNGYFEPYVDRVWAHFAHPNTNRMRINTQAGFGTVAGSVSGDPPVFTFHDQAFTKPSTADIFGCSTGPFSEAGANEERKAIIPRLAAAFNRGTALIEHEQPAATVKKFYPATERTNHYGRIVHDANVDHKGYTFPYDDVAPDGGVDQSGKVNDGAPDVWTVAVGGATANSWIGS